jgi:hypothetical protein
LAHPGTRLVSQRSLMAGHLLGVATGRCDALPGRWRGSSVWSRHNRSTQPTRACGWRGSVVVSKLIDATDASPWVTLTPPESPPERPARREDITEGGRGTPTIHSPGSSRPTAYGVDVAGSPTQRPRTPATCLIHGTRHCNPVRTTGPTQVATSGCPPNGPWCPTCAQGHGPWGSSGVPQGLPGGPFRSLLGSHGGSQMAAGVL